MGSSHLRASGSDVSLAVLADLLVHVQLVIRITKTVLSRQFLDLDIAKAWHFLGRSDVGHIFEVALGEDEIDLLE